jgi:hypothetical protein
LNIPSWGANLSLKDSFSIAFEDACPKTNVEANVEAEAVSKVFLTNFLLFML